MVYKFELLKKVFFYTYPKVSDLRSGLETIAACNLSDKKKINDNVQDQ